MSSSTSAPQPPTRSTPGDPPRPEPAPGSSSWPLVVLWALGTALVAVVAAYLSGATRQLLLVDAGPVVRWALPVVRGLLVASTAVTLGALGTAAFVVPERRNTARLPLLRRVALGAAVVWAVMAWALSILTFSEVLGTSLTAPDFWTQYFAFWWELDLLAQIQLAGLVAAVVAVVVARSRERSGLHWAFWIAVIATLPLAFTGHSGGTLDHSAAVNGYGAHLIAVSVWTGGLVGLTLLWRGLGEDRAVAVARYSTVALWAYVVAGLSGVLNASLRVEMGDLLGTSYGQLLVAKTLLLMVLGGFGVAHRRSVVERLRQDPGARTSFTRLAGVELAIMALAAGLGSALARTPTPVPEISGEAIGDPAVALTGYPTPTELTWMRWVTAWEIEWLFTTVAVVAVALYAVGWWRLKRRGDSWPWQRLPLWILGWAVFLYIVDGAPTVYGRVMFSAHMVMHMSLMMAIPLLLVPAAPITLALRTLPARKDRTIGPREWILGLVHSKYAQTIGHPVIAGLLFFFSLVIFYWSPLLELALTTHGGHVLMVVHFLGVGYLFVWSLVGPDPGGVDWPAPLRLLVLIATLAGHAFFGVAMMMGTYLLAPDFFTSLNLPWVTDLVADQQLGGGIAWGIGELPTVILAILVGLEWANTDERESRRYDRKAVRDHDAELSAYNERLAAMGAADAGQESTPQVAPEAAGESRRGTGQEAEAR
ncbi:putative copper resistance protein D [Kytococcus aerolatus]|uniref:Putative copper resistance protein D n=1 Tax=Kytococcus aerolatus TaxID=592308 RepID=A0A212THZ0_9MICO|nr:cytochrome c oxidase assembly protein [Kytococcus aerolatus]SNC65441.1 putative copper resistance protein D [Kytococcus aerolatus]